MRHAKHADEFAGRHFFFGATERLYHDFEDPAALEAPEAERLARFARVRDELRAYLREFTLRAGQKQNR